jgi:RNA polymerase sigma-70 factor (ECF subfamily)
MARGPQFGLARLDALAGGGAGGSLDGNYLFHAARADLLSRLGRFDEARSSYLNAAALATTAPEQRFLQRRLDELDDLESGRR